MRKFWERILRVSLAVKVIGFSLALILGVLIIATYNAIQIVHNQERLFIKDEEKTINKLQTEMEELAKQYLTTAITISEQRITKEALRTKNRDLLIPYAQKLLKDINTYSPEPLKIHYHQLLGVSFLRVWKPQKWGDDLRSFRHTVVKVQKTGRPIAGIEAGRAGLAIRGVAPVIDDDGTVLGSVEVFSSINAYANKKARPGMKDIAILRKELVKTFEDKGDMDLGDYRLIFSTQDELFKPVLNQDLLRKLENSVVHLKKGNILFIGAPILDFSGKVTGIWLSALNLSSFSKAQNDIILKNIIYATLLALIAAILLFIHNRKTVIEPLRACLVAVDNVAEGNLNVEVKVKNKDEIGRLAHNINHMISNLRELVRKINKGTSKIEETEAEILDSSENLLNASQDAENKINLLVESSKGNQERITQLASANEEITTTVQNVSQNVGETVNMLQQVTDQVEHTIGIIGQLNQHFNKIEEVVTFISQIADQTNLLALNATIEAARAGEAGKGFAVVANEVKELARQTAEATEKIVQTIQDLHHLVEGSVEAVHKMDELINPVKEMAENMAVAMEQTSHAAQEISLQSQGVLDSTRDCFCHLEEINAVIQGVIKAAEISNHTAKRLRKLSQDLRSLIDNFKV